MIPRQDLEQALKLVEALEYSPEGGWSKEMLVHEGKVVVFPATDNVGESPALVKDSEVTLLGSIATEWPDWYWEVCEEEDHYITLD